MFFNRYVVLQCLFRKPFGIHSPFLYDFAVHGLYSRERVPVFDVLEKQRKTLLDDPAVLQVVDHGMGLRGQRKNKENSPFHYKRTVSSIARRSLQSPALCRLLFRTVRYFSPATILELGTSLGITTAYLAHAAPQARVITLEGCLQTAARADTLFKQNNLQNIELRTGPFLQTLNPALDDLGLVDLVYLDGDHSFGGVMNNYLQISEHIHEHSVLIIDDIRWSAGMKQAWREITAHPRATLAVDLFRLGMVFFNPSLSKQIIQLGY